MRTTAARKLGGAFYAGLLGWACVSAAHSAASPLPPAATSTSPADEVWLPATPADLALCTRPSLDAARESYRRRTPSARVLLARALEQPRNCRPDVVEIYRLMALVTGDEERAQRLFEILLALEPDFRLGTGDEPPWEPKIERTFGRALEVPSSRRALGVSALASPQTASLRLVDPLQLVDVVEVYARRPRGAWQRRTLRTGTHRRADDVYDIPMAAPFAWFAVLRDPWGGVLAQLGSRADPRVVNP